jgi:hypothetical protein
MYFRKEDAKLFNKLAREQFKLKLLGDINMDLEICRIEGWEIMEYLDELLEIINSIRNKVFMVKNGKENKIDLKCNDEPFDYKKIIL